MIIFVPPFFEWYLIGMKLQMCVFVSHLGKFQKSIGTDRREAFASTQAGKGATTGANATIFCGHDIGAPL